MQLPRRVPWTSRAELQHVCDWIYSPDSTPNDRDRALHRLSAWAATTTLPAALSATLALLSALALDSPARTAPAPAPALPARQAYTLALLRLVNGLVDPLQSGMYARPIAHIATQLGLPAWWVELRHQGTHDDLPGLAVLRLAAHEALDWLYTHYFLPTLHPSSPATTSLPHHPIPSAAALLKAYKTLSKQITRDSSLLGPSRREMERLLRAWQRWVAEVRVAVGVGAAGGGAGWGTAGEEEREREREALECVAEALLERGGLVPVSRKKRPTLTDPTLPRELAALWQKLLDNLQAHHPLFAPCLFHVLLARLADQHRHRDATEDACLVGWAAWAAARWAEALGGRAEALGQACGLLGEMGEGGGEGLRALVRLLAGGDHALGRGAEVLLRISGGTRQAGWEEGSVSEMEARLAQLQAALARQPAPLAVRGEAEEAEAATAGGSEAARGWRMLARREWAGGPIGWVGPV